MTLKQFKYELERDGIDYKESDSGLVVSPHRSITLYMETIPDNITFIMKKTIVFVNLISLPPSTIFKSRDGVDFTNLVFRSLELLPDNYTFNIDGSIHLNNLKKLPNNINFNNDGIVHLPALESEKQIYNGEEIIVKYVPRNNITTIIKTEEKIDKLTVYVANFFEGSRCVNHPPFYLAELEGQVIKGSEKGSLMKTIREMVYRDFSVFNFKQV